MQHTHGDYPRDPDEFMEYCDSLTYTELRQLICKLDAGVVSIQNTVDNNRRLQVTLHDLGRSEGALRWELWRLRTAKQYCQTKKPDVQSAFVDTARSLLSPTQFATILAEAKAMAAEKA